MSNWNQVVRNLGYTDERLMELARRAADAEDDMERAFSIIQNGKFSTNNERKQAYRYYQSKSRDYRIISDRTENRMKYLNRKGLR